MTWPLFALLIVSLLLGAAGQTCLKAATNAAGAIGSIGTLTATLLHPMTLFGLAFYIVSTLLYLTLMSRMPLSYLYPMVALNYVFVTILSWHFFGEQITPLRVAGLVTIIAGVTMVGLSLQLSEEQARLADPPPAAVATAETDQV